MRIEVPSACEAAIVLRVRVGDALQQHSTNSALPGTEPEPGRPYRSNGTEQGDVFLSSLD